jgi:hypothetical protein
MNNYKSYYSEENYETKYIKILVPVRSDDIRLIKNNGIYKTIAVPEFY